MLLQQLGQVLDDDVGAGRGQLLGVTDPVDPPDIAAVPRPPPPPPRPPAPPDTASSNTTAAEGSSPSRRAPARNVSGCGLPRRPSRAVTTPSTRTSIRSAKPAAAMTCSPLADAVTTAVASPASFTARRYRTEPG